MADRDLFFLVFSVSDGRIKIETGARVGVKSERKPLLDFVNIIWRANKASAAAFAAAKPQTDRPPTFSTSQVPPLVPEEVLFFSWAGDDLSANLPACAVPKPAVVFAAVRAPSFSGPWPPSKGLELETLGGSLRLTANRLGGHELDRFLSGPAAGAEPITRFDSLVFIS